MSMKVTLDLIRDGKVLRQCALSARKTIVGRGSNENSPADRVELDDETISSEHAQIQLRGDDVLIQDLRSRNRVQVNEQFINPGIYYRLRHGDIVGICAYCLRVNIVMPRQAPPLQKVPPALGPFRLGLLYAPAGVVAQDFYSCQTIKEKALGLAVGSIAKGAEIREETSVECGEMLRLEAANAPGPAAMLEKLNAAWLTNLATDNPIATVYGVLDPDKGSFRFASAGDIVPLFFHKKKTSVLRKITSAGKPLNAASDSLGLVEKLVRFRPGDVLLLVASGILETSFIPDHEETQRLRNLVREELIDAWSDKLSQFIERLQSRIDEVEKNVGAFGLNGVARTVARSGSSPVETLLSGLEEAVKEHLRGQTPSRDLTVLGIEMAQ